MSADAVVADVETADNTANVDANASTTNAVTDDSGADENVLGAGVDTVDVNVAEGEQLLGGDETPEVVNNAPETYEAFILPEVFADNAEAVEQFSSMAKEIGLSQDQAQKLMDKEAEANAVNADNLNKEVIARQEAWVDELKADPIYGGKKMGETVERARRALRTHGTPELISLLKDNGYGNNPEVVKLFANIDRKMGEDAIVEGKSSTVVERSAASIMYDHPSSQPK